MEIMRAYEFIVEQTNGSLMKDVVHTLPSSYSIPQLKNQDPYLQYRFGVALAGAKARRGEKDDQKKFARETPWGENQVIISYGEDAGEDIDQALKDMNMSGKQRISSKNSVEQPDIDKQSPVKAFGGYR